MTPLIYFLAFVIGLMLVFVWKNLLVIVFPNMFVYVEILTNENYVIQKLELVPKKNVYTYKNLDYLLLSEINALRGHTRIYHFVEGNPNPINFRENFVVINKELEKKMLSLDISDLLSRTQGLVNFFKDYGIIILIVMVAIIGIMIYKQPPTK